MTAIEEKSMLRRTFAWSSIAFALSVLTSVDVMATAQRTFVASYGNDANPCSLTLPCRGFAAAVAQTNDGGEVIVLDSAGYGTLGITRSVSIVAPTGVYAGISVPLGGTGVDIFNAGVHIVLRGLTITGTGEDFTGGSYGVRMTDGAELKVEDCVIANFGAAGAAGVSIETAATVTISGTVISDSNVGVAAGYGAVVNIMNTQVKGSTEGIEVTGGGAGTTTSIFVTDTVVTGGLFDCIRNVAALGTTGIIFATRVTATHCGKAFVNEPLTAGAMSVSSSMAAGSQYGFVNAGGAFQSLGNNHVSGNQFDTAGTITTIGGQ